MRAQRTSTTSLGLDNISRWNEVNARVLAGNVSYGSTMQNTDQDQNLNIWKAQGTAPGTPDTEFAIQHQLNRVPNTIVGQDTSNGGVLYRSTTAWTNTTVYLKCTKASSAYNVIVA